MQESTTTGSPTTKSTPTGGKLGFKTIFMFLFFLAIGLGFAIIGKSMWTNYMADKDRWQSKIAALNAGQEQLAVIEEKLAKTQQDMQTLLEERAANPAMQTLDLASVKDAYLLVSTAQDRLQYANDIQTAKQLLQLAQDQLSPNNPALANAKTIIAADQAKLNAAKSPDLSVVQEKLSFIDSVINNLPLKPVASAPTSTAPSKEVNTGWKESLAKAMDELKSVVKIRKKTAADSGVTYVNNEIGTAQFKLLVEQLRWAIFYRDTATYTRSVKQTQDLLVQLFDTNDSKVQEFAAALEYLASVNVQSETPSVQDAVAALQAILVG